MDFFEWVAEWALSLLYPCQLLVFLFYLLTLVVKLILLWLQLPASRFQLLTNLRQVSLVSFILLILRLNLQEHVVDPVYLVSQSSVFLTHIVLKVNQFWCSNSLTYRVLHKMLRIYFLLHVVVVLIFVLVIHEHSRVDFVVHRWLLMQVDMLTR